MTSPLPLPITIQPLSPADAHPTAHLTLSAFSTHPRMLAKYPLGATPSLKTFLANSTLRDLSSPSTPFSYTKIFKAVHASEPETILGVADYTFALDVEANLRVEEPALEGNPPEDWPEGANYPMRLWFKWNLWRLLRRDFDARGRGYILVNLLATSPTHQKQGIGRQLLSWGMQQADLLGVPMCLEATPAGFPLYVQCGFVKVEEIHADFRGLGFEGEFVKEEFMRIWMVREPRVEVKG